MIVDPVFLEVASDLGSQYIAAMQLGGAYAYAGRDWVCSRVARLLGASIVEEVHNHHNYAWQEQHEGRILWVCRKGATPAFPGQRGFVGGTMGEMSVILEGVESPESGLSLYSTVHGPRSTARAVPCAASWPQGRPTVRPGRSNAKASSSPR